MEILTAMIEELPCTEAATLSTLTIDLNAIEKNLDIAKKKAGRETRIMAIIKAAAYGTDMVTLAFSLEEMGVDLFGVAQLAEAVMLRRAGFRGEIFVIYTPEYQLQEIPRWDLQTSLCSKNSLETLHKAARLAGKRVLVHLHIDTGMSRFGCRREEAASLAEEVAKSPWLQLEGVMSHFHSADLPEKDKITLRQVQLFDSAIASIEERGIAIPFRHMANSSALCRFHLPQYNMVRIGIALYGAHLSEACQEALPLELALKLATKVIDIKRYKRGQTVSYEAAYVVREDEELIGTLGIGYHDGLRRCLSNSAYCCIGGRRAPYVGKICMDFSLVNLTALPDVKVGDEATIFGKDRSGYTLYPRELTSVAMASTHELISCIGPRVARNIVGKRAAGRG